MKKIFLLIMLSAGSLFAGQNFFFYVNNPDELDFFATVFNAIPMILGDDEYMTLLRLAFLMGGFLTLTQMVLGAAKDAQGGLINFTKFQILGVAILTLVFADKSTVILKSNEVTSYYRTSATEVGTAIDNVPTTLAYAFEFFHTTGTELTKKFEMAFANISTNPDGSLGGSYSMIQHGYASSLSHNLQLLNYDFQRKHSLGTQLDDFFSGCVYIPYSAKGVEGQEHIEQINESEDILGLMGSWINSGEMIGGIAAGDYTAETGGELMTCKDLYGLITTTTLPEFLAQAPNDPVLSKINDEDLGMLKSSRAVPISDFEQMATQAGIINTMANAKNLSTGIPYAQGRERANFNMNNISQASFMAQQLPIMQNLFRGILYGIFPFMLVVLMMPGGLKVISEYGKTLLWVESWGIMAAIISYNIQRYTEKSLAVSGTNGLTLNNSVDLLSTTASMAGMSGYLYLSIPPLTWLLLKGSGQMLGSLTGGISSSFAKHLGTAQNAKDAQMMKTKDEVSKQVGHDVSYAEAMNYKAIQAGITEGSSVGTNYNKGEGSQRDLNNYSNLNPYNQLKAKQDALGGGNDKVLAFEKAFGERKTTGDKAYVDNTTLEDASAGGTIKGLDEQNKNYQLGTYGKDNLNDLNKFKSDKDLLGGFTQMSLYDNSPGGRAGTITGMEDVKTGTEIGTYDKNMDYTGGSTSNISDIMSSANNFDLARKDGNVATTTAGANYNSGVKEGAGTNANSKIVDEFGDKNITNNEVYKQETDIWANQAKEEQQASLGGVKTNVQDAAKVEVNDKKADVLTTDNDGNGTLSKSELKDRLDTNTTENQAGHGAKKANLKTEQQLAEQLINSDPLAKKGANNVTTGNRGTKNAQFRNANNHIKKHNDIRSNSVEAKDQRFKEQAGVTASSEALTKASDTTEKVYTTTNSADNRADLIKADVKENYNDVYNQNLKEAQEKGLHGAKAREFAALQTEKEMGNINIGANNKNLYDSRLQAENERISSQRKALGDRSSTKETLSKQKEALQHYKDSGGHDKTVIENFNRNIRATENKLQQHNQLDKDSKNAKFNIQQQMVKEGRATISGGKFHYNDFSNEMNGKDNNAKVLETAKVGGTKGSGKTQVLDSTGKQVVSTKDHTSDVDNVAATAQVGTGISHVGGTDAFAHLNKAGHQKAADNLATGEKYVDKAMKVVETIAPVKNGIKAVTKAATKK